MKKYEYMCLLYTEFSLFEENRRAFYRSGILCSFSDAVLLFLLMGYKILENLFSSISLYMQVFGIESQYLIDRCVYRNES
jgi:hypothetical protein